MFDIKVFLRLTRINEYFNKLILIFPLIFLISPQNFFTYKTILIFSANLFLTAFIYSINDVEDADDDYNDIEKRKRNPIANRELTKKQGYIFTFSLLFMGLILLLTINSLVFLVGFILTLIGFLYSWKFIRLKSLPIIDFISHVICLGILQFSTTYLAFLSFDVKFIPFLMIIVPYSFSSCIFQQLRDYKVDKEVKIDNTIQNFGRYNPTKLFTVLLVIPILGFIMLCTTLSIENIFLSLSIFLGAILFFRCDRFFKLNRFNHRLSCSKF